MFDLFFQLWNFRSYQRNNAHYDKKNERLSPHKCVRMCARSKKTIPASERRRWSFVANGESKMSFSYWILLRNVQKRDGIWEQEERNGQLYVLVKRTKKQLFVQWLVLTSKRKRSLDSYESIMQSSEIRWGVQSMDQVPISCYWTDARGGPRRTIHSPEGRSLIVAVFHTTKVATFFCDWPYWLRKKTFSHCGANDH